MYSRLLTTLQIAASENCGALSPHSKPYEVGGTFRSMSWSTNVCNNSSGNRFDCSNVQPSCMMLKDPLKQAPSCVDHRCSSTGAIERAYPLSFFLSFSLVYRWSIWSNHLVNGMFHKKLTSMVWSVEFSCVYWVKDKNPLLQFNWNEAVGTYILTILCRLSVQCQLNVVICLTI